jgi:hypothetical protein
MHLFAAVISLFVVPHSGALKQKADQKPSQARLAASAHEAQLNRWLSSGGAGASYTLPLAPNPILDHLNGHNILLIGDSNERKLMQFLCNTEVHVVKTATCKDRVIEFPLYKEKDQYPGGSRFCHIPGYNITVMSVFHNGALTTVAPGLPQLRWHSNVLANSSFWLPILNGTTTQISSTDLICYWKSMVTSHLPQRPLKVVAQSSLWDSVLAKKFLMDMNSVVSTSQDRFAAWGWEPSTDPHSALRAWGWSARVEVFLRAVKDEFGLQELFWRTNPNCPIDDDFLNSLSEAQAAEVRQMVGHGNNVWAAVTLIDWRMHYRASSTMECDFIHYQAAGYKTYVKLLWDSL